MAEHTHAEELCCEGCGGKVEIVCKKKNCADPLEQRRKSNGSVAPEYNSVRQHVIRKPIATKKVCRVCKTEKPIGDFEIVYAHYRRADCRSCRAFARKQKLSGAR